MRNRSFCLLPLLFLVWQGPASAQQGGAADGKKAEKQGDVKVGPANEGENWQVLDDVKSGLQPQPPFVFQMDDEPDLVREMVRVEWRTGDPIDLYIMSPKTSGKVPVVLYLYSYPNQGGQFRDNGWAKRATAEGYAAVGFVTALTGDRYHFRPLKQWFISELTESMGSSVHDVQLILNYLADRGDMDVNHVGMFGMGSGASIAILAAQADSRIKALDLLDPWGDWPDWLRDSPAVPEDERSRYTTPEFLKSVAKLDPAAYLPSLKIFRLRVRQTLTDPVTPKSAKDRIATSLRDPRYLQRYANAGVFMQASQADGLSGWIKQQLRSQIQAEEGTPGLTAQDSNSPAN
jgi:cephalosporin-C deacetylase-like acetyl esterase